jgi:hypothetical protein
LQKLSLTSKNYIKKKTIDYIEYPKLKKEHTFVIFYVLRIFKFKANSMKRDLIEPSRGSVDKID